MLILLGVFILLLWSKLHPEKELIFWILFMSTLHVVAFIFGLSFWFSCVFLGLFLALRLYHSNRKWDTKSSRALVLSIPFLLTATMPTRFLDAGTYYDQTAQWFTEGIPKGIGNFDLFLMQCSVAHSNEAILNSINSNGQNNVSVIISTLLIVLAFSREKKINRFYTLIGTIIFLVYVHFAQSSSSDLLLLGLLVYYLLERNSSSRSEQELIALIIILPFIKPVGAGISVLLAIELWQRTKFKYVWILSIAALVFVGKSFWVSGWLPLIGKTAVSFAIPTEAREYLEFRQHYFNYEGRNEFNFNVDLVFGFIYLVLIGFQFISSKADETRKHIIAFGHILILSYWTINTPAARYLFPFYIFILLEIRSNLFLNKVSSIKTLILFLSIGLLSTVPDWGIMLKHPRAKRLLAYGGFSNINWVKPAPLWKIPTKKIVIENGFTCYLPNEPFPCYNSTFPCNSNIARHYNGDSIYLPVYNEQKNSFSYKSLLIDSNSTAILDSLNALPYFPLKR